MYTQLKLPGINHYKIHVFNAPFLHSLSKWREIFNNSFTFCIFHSILKMDRIEPYGIENFNLRHKKKIKYKYVKTKDPELFEFQDYDLIFYSILNMEFSFINK